jgi:hypothetical protein
MVEEHPCRPVNQRLDWVQVLDNIKAMEARLFNEVAVAGRGSQRNNVPEVLIQRLAPIVWEGIDRHEDRIDLALLQRREVEADLDGMMLEKLVQQLARKLSQKTTQIVMCGHIRLLTTFNTAPSLRS